jgi:hypothetical protein
MAGRKNCITVDDRQKNLQIRQNKSVGIYSLARVFVLSYQFKYWR